LFHRRLGAAIREGDRPSPYSISDQWRQWLFSWRLALPVGAALALLILLLVGPGRRENRLSPERGPIAKQTVPAIDSMAAPISLAHYQSLAHRSLDELDALLTEQAINSAVPGPPTTASVPRAVGNFN